MGTKISELTSVDSLAAGDLLVVWDSSNSDSRKVSITTLQQWIADNETTSYVAKPQTQYSAPSGDTTVAITDNGSNTHLILTPTTTISALTITLPALANLTDKQTVTVNSTQAVTTLTIGANGATDVIGEPASLSANDYFTLKYDSQSKNWYRIG